MTETKSYCDHCGKVLDNMVDYVDISIEMSHVWRKHDLCSKCLDKLKIIVDVFCTKYQTEKGGGSDA